MYKQLKNILRIFLSRKTLFRHELTFRKLYYQLYKGRKYICPICGSELRSFVTTNGEKICPACGSLSRNRRLYQLIESEYLKEEISMLDFSPSRHLYRKFKNNPSLDYTSTDLSDNFLADQHYDITDINIKDESYHLILCYHILEHIEDDRKAMQELYRVLTKGGTCIIQTPFKKSDIYEDPKIKTVTERLKHFGQEDHVRIYSIAGLKDRLTACGFTVEINEFNEEATNKFGFKEKECILICNK